ncbi:SRPBCC family protein [Calidifontibacter terrae]
MPSVRRTVRTTAATAAVYAYLADFTNASQWDAGTVSCDLTSGDGGPGTVYRNVSRFLGRTVTLDYTVQRAEPPVFEIVGRTGGTTSHDTITVSADGDSTLVDYLADFTFTGPARLLGFALRPALNRLADRTEQTLRTALDQL